MFNLKLSVIVPVFNEEKTINKVINKILSANFPFEFEIIIVNDGSTDNTYKILDRIKNEKIKIINFKKNYGKGFAIKTGIENCSGDVVIVQDADLEYNPKEIKKLYFRVDKNHKVVYGSRFLGSIYGMKPCNFLANKFLTLLINIIYGSNLTDTQTCYKCIHRDIFRDLNLFSNGFEIESEITSKILKKGYKIKEVPIKYKARTRKEGKKIGWKDGFKNIYVIFKTKFLNC